MIIFNTKMSQTMRKTMIENEKSELFNKQQVFTFHKNILLLYAKKIIYDLKSIEQEKDTQQLLALFSNFKNLFDKIHYIEKNFKDIFELLDSLSASSDIQKEQITNYNDNVNTLQTDWNNLLLELEDFTKDFLNNITTYSLPSLESNIEEADSIIEEKPILEDNNCLLISEKQNKVFLPYKIKDLEQQIIKSKKKYSDINDLIQKEYILPLSKFQNPVLSRFREAYNLMKTKENSSFIEALDIAFELSVNSTLNPAVIAACKNKDELDIYLDCLYEKELEQFKIFEIKYEINPK